MLNIGDEVYIIAKNYQFLLEVTRAKIAAVTDTHIVCERRRNALISDRWEFPRDAWGKEIFHTETDANVALDRIVNWQKYESREGEN